VSDYLLSIILGVVEGLTEFVPVSSTAHLRISQALLHVDLADGYWKMYAIVIQLGAILCVPLYFRSRLAALFATFPKGDRPSRGLLTHPLGLTAVAFIVTAIPSFLLAKVIGHHLESLFIMGTSLLVGGIIMWIVDRLHASANGGVESMSLPQAAWVGLCQIASAVFPGTSRSMSTIAAGQVAGLSRTAAMEFSFLLAIPTMFAATGYDLFKSLRGDGALGSAPIDAHGWVVLVIGFVISFVVAYASVGWLMAYVRRRGFAPFAVYRIVVGSGVLLFGSRFL
jgi:undecaprenyl-diphosphatase